MASKHILIVTSYLILIMTAFRYVDGSRLSHWSHLKKLVDKTSSGNNLKPHFTTINVNITIKEDIKVGSVVFVLNATDNENDTLTFSLDSTGQSLFNVGPLNADTKSVNLTLKTALNRELNTRYEFKAFVSDNPSDITRRNATLNTLLLTVSATDADEGTNGDVKYRFSNDSRSVDKFEIHSNGTITLKGALDYEKESSYELTVVAEDGGVPQQRKTCTVVIDVIDISDMPPVFYRSIYIAMIKENSPKGTSLVKVTAKDGDIEVNNAMKYEITGGNSGGSFTINPDTGLITVNGSIDAERIKSYTLTVRASEVPEPGFNASTRVEVEVLGNAPLQSTQTARTFLETKKKATAERKTSNQLIFLASATGFLLIWLLIWKLPAVLDMLCRF
ncbi:protocadherin Fat 4 isoform X2 [Exaiptasia diaphana]|uniref:Cadherin domain-containing protein n=1 Tax=Exaiptasia diaphana TaxID=2652724 RepID=A0A913XZ93_EXADI|nr:protocadherin Fat 4 isoform X2 [Exaiptasia diaphana]